MPFRLIIQPGAEDAWNALDRTDPNRYRKVGNCLFRLAQDPRNPGLRSKRYTSLDGRYAKPIWQSCVENNTPGAYSIFCHYGPGDGEITVVAITPHP